jgi:drug/metabolite transporter (DMT)-like permease
VLRSAYLAWLAVCLIWGTTYLGIRVALETIPPALVGGIRYAIAGVLLLLILRVRGQRLPPRPQWSGLALLGFLMICLGNGAVIWAEQWVPSGIAAMVVAAAPFWMAGIEACAPDGEPLTGRVLLGLGIGFAGVVALVWPDLTVGGEVGKQFAFGIVALQVACLGWALGSSFSKRRTRDENALAAAALQMLFGGLIMLAIASVRGEWSDLSFTARSLAGEIHLIVFGSLVGYTAYVFALKHLPVSTVSMYAYVNPVIAVALGSILLGEPFGLRVVIASGMVLAGIVVVRLRPTARRPVLKQDGGWKVRSRATGGL